MATTTSNLGLTKPNYADAADVGVLNSNFDVLDREVVKRTNVHNLLDNSDFRNPVNQRGRAGIDLSSGYVLDRWRIWDTGTVYFSSGRYMGLEKTNLFQYIPAPYDRGVLTFAAKVWNGSIHVVTYDTSVIGSVTDGVCVIIREENALATSLVAGHAYEWAALYEGEYTAETLPPYVPKGYAAELAECQRYFQRLFIGNGFVSALAFSNTSARTVFFIPGMRTIPTVSSDIPLRFYVSGSYKTVSSVAVSDMTESAMTIYFTSEGLVTGDVHGIHPNGGTATITLSADL